MSDQARATVHWSFWVVGVTALIWNGLGSMNYVFQMTAESVEAYREVEQAIITNRPAWATAAFAIGVFGGTVGAILLLLRKRLAINVFIVSLVGVVVVTIHTVSLGLDMAIGEFIVIVVMSVAVGAFFVWYAKHADRKGWLG